MTAVLRSTRRRLTLAVAAASLTTAACSGADPPLPPAPPAAEPEPVAASPDAPPAPNPEPVETEARATEPAIVPERAPAFDRVVLVTIDTLRADHVGCYGYPRETTPFLDELAAEGARFERVVASMSHTGPSHASMLTGMHPPRHGLLRNGERMRKGVPTVVRAYEEAGYDTAAFLSVSFVRPVARGFDAVDSDYRDASEVVELASEWVAAPERTARFLLWLHFYDPHRWATQEEPPADEVAALNATDPEDFSWAYVEELHGLEVARADGDFRIEFGNAHSARFLSGSPEAYLDAVDAYDARIRWVDRELRAFRDRLTERFTDGVSLWVVTSDHGEGMGSHRNLGHGGAIYNEQLLVPLVLWASDGSVRPADGDRVAELVQLVDLMPTLAQAVGAEPRGYDPLLDGASLWPLLRSEVAHDAEWRPRPAFSMRKPADEGKQRKRMRDLFALQSDRHKWLAFRSGEGRFFDLAADPRELEDRAESGASEQEALKRLLEDQIERLEAGVVDDTAQEIPDAWLEELRALGYVE